MLLASLGVSERASAQQTSYSCTCNCLKLMFDYLSASHNLLIPQSYNTRLLDIIQEASKNGYPIDYRRCALFARNINKPFYAITTDSITTAYKARIGDCTLALNMTDGVSRNLYKLKTKDCTGDARIDLKNNTGGDATVAVFKADSCFTCTDVQSSICVSAITQSPVNPYLYGMAGNWRPAKAYTYYATRKETDPAQETDIRTNGTFNGFAPFWAIQSNKLAKQNDDGTKWVWNAATTLFNKKGFEVENKDPLGRYNAGLYGYDNALPVAVIQNSHYREAAFEGFEDYGFTVDPCDTVCAPGRNFDFSDYKQHLDSLEHHTGRYSLKVTPETPAGISANLVAADTDAFDVTVTKTTDPCTGTTQLLKSINANENTVLPPFSPLSGKSVLVSAWVKEVQNCSVSAYTATQIGIVVKQGSTTVQSIIARPKGNIIEGWQRIEEVVILPAGATLLSINLQATGTNVTAYFDDVRVHPYNANMRSFVYSSVNLRLMAELDENNYATFYEYDDDGTLIRLKKETERGIKTIKETRTALLKEKNAAQ